MLRSSGNGPRLKTFLSSGIKFFGTTSVTSKRDPLEDASHKTCGSMTMLFVSRRYVLKRCGHSAIICLKISAEISVGLSELDTEKNTYTEDNADGVLGKRDDDNCSGAGAVQLGEVDDFDRGFQCEGRHIGRGLVITDGVMKAR